MRLFPGPYCVNTGSNCKRSVTDVTDVVLVSLL